MSRGGQGETTDFIFQAFSFLLAFLDLNHDFFLMGETSDIYLLNFICVSVKQVVALQNSFLWTQRSLLIAPMCIFSPRSSF